MSQSDNTRSSHTKNSESTDKPLYHRHIALRGLTHGLSAPRLNANIKIKKLASALGAISRNQTKMILDRLIPPYCPISGDVVSAPGQLSARGWASIQFIEAPYCTVCSLPFTVDHGEEIRCGFCLTDYHNFGTARCAVVYDDVSRPLIVSFKHGDRTELVPLLSGWLARVASDVIASKSILIPVPLHRQRLIARRFNQAALLASAAGKLTKTKVLLEAVERHRPTLPQKDLSTAGRQRNVSGAFRVASQYRSRIKGAHIVLVDDVMTTGATLSACARPILAAGAARVDALVLARVVNDGRQTI